MVSDLQKVLLAGGNPVSNIGAALDKEGNAKAPAKAQGFQADVIYGDANKNSLCAVNYNEHDTETDYIMGFQPRINDEIRADREAKQDAEKAAKAGTFRFKEGVSSKHKDGFMINFGNTKRQFILSKNRVDPDRCYDKATNKMMRL